jgi:diguanylate cyclase (GGDEF)-like protein
MLLSLLHQEEERARRFGSRFALLVADLDRFKPVNDRHGHAAGDQLLLHVARRLSGAVRASDIVARIGGDEFAVLMREPGDASAVEALAARIKTAVKAPYRFGDLQVSVELSLGTAFYPVERDDLHTLFELADQRLYASKRPSARPLRLVWPPEGRDGRAEPISCGSGRA